MRGREGAEWREEEEGWGGGKGREEVEGKRKGGGVNEGKYNIENSN